MIYAYYIYVSLTVIVSCHFSTLFILFARELLKDYHFKIRINEVEITNTTHGKHK